jgi:hypothetical protein
MARRNDAADDFPGSAGSNGRFRANHSNQGFVGDAPSPGGERICEHGGERNCALHMRRIPSPPRRCERKKQA